MIVFLFNLLLLAATNAATKAPTSFPKGLMIGGKNVEIEEVPYQAVIFYKSRPICGGVIISQQQILTSAHCLVDYPSYRQHYNVSVGSSLRDTADSQYLEIKRINLHESFAGTRESIRENKPQIPINDLAMIITSPMDFNTKRQPIQLFDETEDVGVGVDALITGWLNINGSQHLTTRVVQTLDTALCDTAYEDVGGVPAGQICAAYPGAFGKHGCVGDSGGPLVVDGRLAGILSWGNGCVKPRYPGVYIELSYYRDWIDNGGRDMYKLV